MYMRLVDCLFCMCVCVCEQVFNTALKFGSHVSVFVIDDGVRGGGVCVIWTECTDCV